MPKETYALGRRNEIIKVQDAQIKQLYKEAAEEVADRAKFFMNRDNISSVLRTQYLSELSEQLRQRMESIDSKTQNIILNGMRNVSSSVVKENAERLLRMGFTNVIASTSYLYVPDDIVRELVSGKLFRISSLAMLSYNSLVYIAKQGTERAKIKTIERIKDLILIL